MAQLQRIWRLVCKELTSTLTDPFGRIVLFIPPLIQLVIFSFALSQEITNARIAVLNLDAGLEGSALCRAFRVEPVFREAVNVSSYREVDEALEKERVLATVVIPEDFTQKLQTPGETATLQVTLDGRRANGSGILGGYISQIVSKFGAEAQTQVSSASVHSSGLVVRRWFNPNLTARKSFMPGLVCIVMTTVGMLASATSIARERETGSFDQLIVSPLSPVEIVVGKGIAGGILAMTSALLILGVVVFGFKIPLQGPLWLFLATTALYLTSIISVGLFISSLSITQQQATLGMFLVLPPAIMLSGFATPVENMPEFLQWCTIVNPVRWELAVMKGLLTRGASTSAILPLLIPLACAAVFSFSGACFMFKRRME